MSYTINAPFDCIVDDTDSRMVAEIQRKTIKQSKRNVLSRFFHATSDKETIAGWRSDLNRILLVFNVRSVVFVWPLLTINSQTELAINTHVTTASTHAIVLDIRNEMLKGREGTDNQHQAVGDTRALQHHRINAHHLSDSK